MTEVMEKTAQVKIKSLTKLNLIVGMISTLFIGAVIFNFAFLTTPLTVTVSEEKDIILPYVTINSPRNGELISGEVTIEAFAYDEQKVKNVSFYIDNTLKEMDYHQEDSWIMKWNTESYTNGTYTISASVTDQAGNRSVSQPVTVMIKNE